MKTFDTEPSVSVGILTAPSLNIRFDGPWQGLSTPHQLTIDHLDRPTIFQPLATDATFTIANVTIGVNFHWQQHEDQTFRGSLELIPTADGILAVNHIPVEDYLLSVCSSEMNANAPLEFLRAHAIISRSWLLAQITPRPELTGACRATDEETHRWYDHEAHTLFHVCADDHCQRYQGITRVTTPQVREALQSTRGIVLTDADSQIADARFSKCCGGATELFSTCWQPVDLPYLRSFRDIIPAAPLPDLTVEAQAAEWINGHPDAFCANPDPTLLQTILNTYDRDTTPDFYRWSVSYTAAELADIIRSRSGIDFGAIISIEALHRGPSGRIDRLRISGTRATHIVGKELEIRRWLSTTHLRSSAFIAIAGEPDDNGIPQNWTIRGAGWGHGVGLCQIGAAVMASRGFTHSQILNHYFPGAALTRLY